MTATTLLLVLPLLIAAGALAGLGHAALLRRAVEGCVEARSATGLLIGAPLRLALPAGVVLLATLAARGPGAGAALLGFVVASHLVRWRALREEPA
jgi:phosphotransferase system  glucose/maltose/N-acetylglucosamine-specific IIC component